MPPEHEVRANADLVNEHLVDAALELVATVRDGGPAQVRDVLARVHQGRHDALCVVLAAMVDPDRTPRELLGWVDVPLSVQSRDQPRPYSTYRIGDAHGNANPREHGTDRGYYQHRARGDMPACDDCLRAHADATTAKKREVA